MTNQIISSFFISLLVPLSIIAGFVLIQSYYAWKEHRNMERILKNKPKAVRKKVKKEVDRLLFPEELLDEIERKIS